MPEVISLAGWRFERQQRMDKAARDKALRDHIADDGRTLAAQLDRLTASIHRIEQQMKELRGDCRIDKVQD
jgi:cell division protein FtsB